MVLNSIAMEGGSTVSISGGSTHGVGDLSHPLTEPFTVVIATHRHSANIPMASGRDTSMDLYAACNTYLASLPLAMLLVFLVEDFPL